MAVKSSAQTQKTYTKEFKKKHWHIITEIACPVWPFLLSSRCIETKKRLRQFIIQNVFYTPPPPFPPRQMFSFVTKFSNKLIELFSSFFTFSFRQLKIWRAAKIIKNQFKTKLFKFEPLVFFCLQIWIFKMFF